MVQERPQPENRIVCFQRSMKAGWIHVGFKESLKEGSTVCQISLAHSYKATLFIYDFVDIQ